MHLAQGLQDPLGALFKSEEIRIRRVSRDPRKVFTRAKTDLDLKGRRSAENNILVQGKKPLFQR